MGGANTTNVYIFIPWSDSFTFCRTGICRVCADQQARRTGNSPSPTSSVHVEGHEGLVGHMRVDSLPLQQADVKLWHSLCEGMEMGRVSLDGVCSGAGDTNLIFASILEAGSLVGDLVQEPQALLLGAAALLNHAGEVVNFGRDVDHGGGEDGIEFSEVADVAGDIEGQRVEGVGVLGEEGERVGGVHGRLVGVGRRRGTSTRVDHCGLCRA